MRFDFLALEKYGFFPKKTLLLRDQPSLVIIHGPNEAGKSTMLAAIADFLFGINTKASHGPVLGNGQTRLDAGLELANGDKVELCRRKGKAGKSLTTGQGKPVEETILSAILGATKRERFTTLFGLSHAELRIGAQRLMAADGEIGQLIVEAGGGLRALVDAMKKLENEANELFTTRKSDDRAFYVALNAYSKADASVKDQLRTNEHYEEARKRNVAAQDAYELLKALRKSYAEKISREQRVLRVAPLLVELQAIDDQLVLFVDIPKLAGDFSARVSRALWTQDAARKAFIDAESSRAGLEADIEALRIDVDLLKVEAAIRDVGTRQVRVENERQDRPNRLAEVAGYRAKLASLEERIGPNFGKPDRAGLGRVQDLVANGIELGRRSASLRQQLTQEETQRTVRTHRQSASLAAGFDKPLGIEVSEFSTLPQLVAELDRKTRKLAGIQKGIDEQVLGLRCPEPIDVQRQLERESKLEDALAEHEKNIASQTVRQNAAMAEVTRLKASGEIPSDDAIRASRNERTKAWDPIRIGYREGSESISVASRETAITYFEERLLRADSLADRKSSEALRITDLASADKRRDEAALEIFTSKVAQQAAAFQLQLSRQGFADMWPEALAYAKTLASLKELSVKHLEVVGQSAEAHALQEDCDRTRTDLDLRMQTLALVDTGSGPLAHRIQLATQRIRSHADGYAAWRTEAALQEESQGRIANLMAELHEVQNAQIAWRDDWQASLLKVQLALDTAPGAADEIARDWLAATGDMKGLEIAQKRLDQFVVDERGLVDAIAALVPGLSFALPDDPVTAAKMLKERFNAARTTQNQKDGLLPELAKHTKECERKAVALGAAETVLAGLCNEAQTDREGIAQAAELHKDWNALLAKEEQTRSAIRQAGDGRLPSDLHVEWSGRELDTVLAELSEMEADHLRAVTAIEVAFAELQTSERDLRAFETAGTGNRLIAERERAAAEMHRVLERYVEVTLALELLEEALSRLRAENQDPLLARAGQLFSLATRGMFSGIHTEVDGKGNPVVLGIRDAGSSIPVNRMSDGTSDQLFLAFRLASIEQYCTIAEPLPFIADDLLVHFDDERTRATLEILAEVSATTQVLLFTHHESVCEAAKDLVEQSRAGIIRLERASAASLHGD